MSKSFLYDEYHEVHYSRSALPYLDLDTRLKIAQLPARLNRLNVDDLTDRQYKVCEWLEDVLDASPLMHPQMRLPKSRQGVRVESDRNLVVVGEAAPVAAVTALRTALTDRLVSGAFVSAAGLFDMFTDAERNGGKLPDGYFDPLMLEYLQRRLDIVVVNDLGDEALTEFRREAFKSFLATRSTEMMPVIVTTILDKGKLTARYGEQVARYLSAPRSDIKVVGD